MSPLEVAMSVLRSRRVKVLLCSLVLLLVLYGFGGLYMDSHSSSVEQCQGTACAKLPPLDPKLDHTLVKLAAPSFNHRHHLAAAPSEPPPSIQLPEPVLEVPAGNRSIHHASLYRPAPPLSPHYRNLTMNQAAGVKRFIFFIGYGRSGHSIVGSIMDAHPNVIIAHEFYLFDKLPYFVRRRLLDSKLKLFDQLYHSSYESATRGWRSNRMTSKGYNLNMNGTWQGQFDQLKVIGDKTGGSTAMLYYNHPIIFKRRLRLLDLITRTPHSAVHVVRNPYDMIATVAMFQASVDVNNIKVTASVQDKFKETQFLRLGADIVLSKAEAVAKMVEECQLEVLEIHLEDLIAEPSAVIGRICEFLEVPCTEEYVNACKGKLFKRASYSRDLVEWPHSVKKRIDRAIKQFSFFKQYSFEGR